MRPAQPQYFTQRVPLYGEMKQYPPSVVGAESFVPMGASDCQSDGGARTASKIVSGIFGAFHVIQYMHVMSYPGYSPGQPRVTV